MKLTRNRIKQIIREELQNEIKLSRNDPRNPPKYQQGGQRLRRTNPRYYFNSPARPYGDAHSSGGWLEPDDQKSHSVAIVDEKTKKIVRLFHDVPSEVVHRAMLGDYSSHRERGAPDKLDLEIEKSLGLNDPPTAKLHVVHHADSAVGYDWDEEKGELYTPEITDEKLKELFDIDWEGRGFWHQPSAYRYRRIPTFEYIERFYPNMPWYDYNDFLTPIGKRGGKRQAGPVIDLEDGE